MYTAFFALSEVPFSIAPNPRFLFMSDRHREALSHLTHGLGGAGVANTGGFVLLTGEVGTGKTTISRCLMEQLPENVQSAFILNPTLSSQELLATICDELNIKYRKTGATLKTLTDKIQNKLLKNHESNINTLLIIDEAQHLQPEVLEQLRLLTNLETNTKKLLQVILIGQPELQQLLKRRDLRQLAQRITARYHLLPLNKQEVASYIKHRLSVVDCHRNIFSNSAVALIHKLSQGIPRLINLLCDRSLMNAYNNNDAVVTKKCVIKASLEALGEEYQVEPWWQKKLIKWPLAISSLTLVLFLGIWWGQQKNVQQNFSATVQTPPKLDKTEAIKTKKLEAENIEAVNDKDNVAKQIEQSILVANVDVPEKVKQVKEASHPALNNEQFIEQPSKNAVKEPFLNDTVKLLASQPTSHLVKETISEKPVEPNKQIQSNEIREAPKFNVNSVDGVSDEFLVRFQSAIEETADISSPQAQEIGNEQAYQNTAPLTDMPDWVQKSIPPLEFDMHIYASDGEGWIRVNGRDRYEGDKIADNVYLEKILPQKVILSYRGEYFSLPALSSW